jgi:hypothetical protein
LVQLLNGRTLFEVKDSQKSRIEEILDYITFHKQAEKFQINLYGMATIRKN